MAEVILGTLTAILRFINFIVSCVFAVIYYRKPPSIPPIKNSLLKLSATTLAKKIRARELSSQTVVEAYIERIMEVNPFLNAVVEDRFEAAVNDAKICDARLKNGEVNVWKLEEEKPLYGVPITIKESCSLKGMSYTGGTLQRKGVKATEDGAAVALLKNAGAIPLLVSNTPELCSGLQSSNFLFGTTVNPYDRRKTPAGSSGGEAALISAGASVFGLGSDLVGSIRVPALFTGIFGHKPTAGVVPLDGHLPTSNDSTFQKILVLGPLARYMDDVYLAMKVLSSKCEIPLRLNESVDISKLQVFYFDNIDSFCGVRSSSPAMRQKIQKATQYLAEKGASVEQISEDLKRMIENLYPMLVALLSDMELPNLLNIDQLEEKNSIREFTKSIVGLSQYTSTATFAQLVVDTKAFMSPSKIKQYRNMREELRQKMNDLLKGNKVLICPSFPYEALFPHTAFFKIDSCIYSALANICQLPATSVPMGLNKNGLPTGFQVISACYQDHVCLAVAKELEKAFGGWIPPS